MPDSAVQAMDLPGKFDVRAGESCAVRKLFLFREPCPSLEEPAHSFLPFARAECREKFTEAPGESSADPAHIQKSLDSPGMQPKPVNRADDRFPSGSGPRPAPVGCLRKYPMA